jgi:ribosomal protein L35
MAKRFKVTEKGKVLKRAAGQDHFNARESGNTTRGKRRDKTQHPAFAKTIKKLTQQQ